MRNLRNFPQNVIQIFKKFISLNFVRKNAQSINVAFSSMNFEMIRTKSDETIDVEVVDLVGWHALTE